VESPAMRMRSIGSICTATVKVMGVWSKAMGISGSVYLEPIRVRLVTGKPSPRDEDGVAPQRQGRCPWVAHEPNARGASDSPPLGRADRNRRDFQLGPRFDFNKGDRAASSGDEVDFASRDHESPRQDRVALEAQEQRRVLSTTWSAGSRGFAACCNSVATNEASGRS
jgi:hypothetical protein